MHVQFISISGGRKQRRSENLHELLAIAASNNNYQRIAFGGRTPLGKAGVAINLIKGAVTGHKLEQIPDELLNLLQHVPLSRAREGLDILAKGIDVLIGDQRHGTAIKWNGTGLEIYAAGLDSELDSSLIN
jgi:hypothetical protein